MPEEVSRKPMILLVFTSFFICFLLFADFGKPSTLLFESIINLGHVPLFAVVAGMTLLLTDRNNWIRTKGSNYLWTFAVTAGLSMTSEIIQHFIPGRSLQAGDIFNDLMGGGIFLLVAYQFRQGLQKWARIWLSSATFFILLTVCLPVVLTATDELRARKDFPLLASFETQREMERWMSVEGSFRRTSMNATAGSYSLEVLIPPGLYPGITMDYPPRDWRGYNILSFDAFLEGKAPLPLTVRINDLRHNEEFEDRYNSTITLQPGPNHVMVDLSEVEHAPKGRLMNMEHVSMICIFSYRLKEQRTLYLDNLRLEKDG